LPVHSFSFFPTASGRRKKKKGRSELRGRGEEGGRLWFLFDAIPKRKEKKRERKASKGRKKKEEEKSGERALCSPVLRATQRRRGGGKERKKRGNVLGREGGERGKRRWSKLPLPLQSPEGPREGGKEKEREGGRRKGRE